MGRDKDTKKNNPLAPNPEDANASSARRDGSVFTRAAGEGKCEKEPGLYRVRRAFGASNREIK
jgi:hypothetical protein